MSDIHGLTLVLETAIDAVIVMDGSGVIVDWNARAEALFGWRRDDVLGRSLGETIIPKRLRLAHAKGLARDLAAGEQAVLERVVELQAQRRDGAEFPAELSIRPFQIQDSRLFLGFVRDISERRDAAAKLAASEARFRVAMEAVDGVLWTNNAAGEMSGHQLGWAALTGQTQAQYQGYGWSNAVHPEDAEPTVRAWNAAVAERRPFIFEHRVLRHDGIWRDFAIHAIPALNADGSIREWVGVHTDITERKLTETRLRESETRFRTIADIAPAPVWMTGVSGDVEFANQAFTTFAGFPRDGLRGKAWIDLVHPQDLTEAFAKRAEAWNVRQAFALEARFRRHDGVYRWLLVTATPRQDIDGAFQGYVGMAMDVTDAKNAQARQHLLINELNHRVKNTLASVQSIARQTLKGDDAPLDERERFINRLLAMSAAHDVLTREGWEGADIHDVVAQAVSPFRDEEEHERIRLEGPPLRLDPLATLALALALHELGTNAVRYGALSVTAGRVVLEWSAAPNGLTRLSWREEGGPHVQEPQRRGFGSRLLSRGLTSDLGGQPQLEFKAGGVEAILSIRAS